MVNVPPMCAAEPEALPELGELLDPPPPEPPQPAANTTAAMAPIATRPRQNRFSITPPREVDAARSMTPRRRTMLVIARGRRPDKAIRERRRARQPLGRRGRRGQDGDGNPALALVDEGHVVADRGQFALL